MFCHPIAQFISSLLFYMCVWLTLIARLSSQSLCQRPPLKTAQAWEIFFLTHLNFYTSICSRFNLAYNDAIRTKIHLEVLLGAVNVPWHFAANAIVPALATDALKATDRFFSIIAIMPLSRINVAACAGLKLHSRPHHLQWIGYFYAFFAITWSVKHITHLTQRRVKKRIGNYWKNIYIIEIFLLLL